MLRKLYHTRIGRGIKKFFWYPIKRRYCQWQIGRVLQSRDIAVLVYQMGKVASKSIEKTLLGLRGVQVFHLHNLSPENIRIQEAALQGGRGRDSIAHMLELGRLVHQHLVRSGYPIKIISLVREPIGRNVSAYFQNLDEFWGKTDAHRNVPMKELIRAFEESYPQDEPLAWFDRELKSATGVDVYATSFPHDLGYVRIRAEQFDIFIMRFDLDDKVKAKCIGDLLGLDQLRFVRENLSDEKGYADTYRQFRQNLKLSEKYVTTMLDSKYARHFYSDAERIALKEKWLGGRSASSP